MPDWVRSRHRTRWIVLAATATMVTAGSLYYAFNSRTPCNCPSDSRNYGPEPCWGWYVQGATTFEGALGYYGVKLLADTTGVRFYIDRGAFNGGDGFYVRFNVPRAELSLSLAQMNATRAPVPIHARRSRSRARRTPFSAGHSENTTPTRYGPTRTTRPR